jgi:hypothetical protein
VEPLAPELAAPELAGLPQAARASAAAAAAAAAANPAVAGRGRLPPLPRLSAVRLFFIATAPSAWPVVAPPVRRIKMIRLSC